MHVPERRISPVHVAIETNSTRAMSPRERRRRGKVAVRSLVLTLRRLPPGRLVVADRSSVVVVAARVTAATAVATPVEAVVAVAVHAVAIVVVIFVSVDVLHVFVAATRMLATGAQGAADEREQLLYVPVELIWKTRDAGTVRRRHGAVSQHVRLKVHGLGVPLCLMLLL